MDVIGLIFLLSLIAAIIAVVVKVIRRRKGYSEYDCPHCEHFLDNSCQIPDKPYMTNCRAFRRYIKKKK